MLSRIPFLIVSVSGEALVAAKVLLRVAPSAAAPAAQAEVFRNRRRVSLLINPPISRTSKCGPAVVGARFSASEHGLESGPRKNLNPTSLNQSPAPTPRATS